MLLHSIAHEIAVAHKAAMDQASLAHWEHDPKLQLQRLHVSAKMMSMVQAGLLVTVLHVKRSVVHQLFDDGSDFFPVVAT